MSESETEIVERLKQSLYAVMDARLEEVTKPLRDRAEAAEAEAAALKKLEAAHRGEEARKAAELRKQLADVSALVPDLDWLKMLALAEHPIGPANCTDCPFWNSSTGRCEDQCDEVDTWATDLADRIRAWRGDGEGDGNEEQEKE